MDTNSRQASAAAGLDLMSAENLGSNFTLCAVQTSGATDGSVSCCQRQLPAWHMAKPHEQSSKCGGQNHVRICMYVRLNEHFCCRIHPSLTSTLRILLLISMERSTLGRVSARKRADQSFAWIPSYSRGQSVASVWLALITHVSFWRCCPFAVCGWTSAESGTSRRLSRPYTWRRWENTFAGSSAEVFIIIGLKEQTFIHARVHELVRELLIAINQIPLWSRQEGSWFQV